MKILHCSDLHIGSTFKWLSNKATVHRQNLKLTFQRTVEYAITQKVDLFIVTGDLFDTPFPNDMDVKFVRELLYKLSDNNISIAIIAGNHDRLEKDSVWMQENWNYDTNIYVFNDVTNVKVWEDKKLIVYGNSSHLQNELTNPLEGILDELDKNKRLYNDYFHVVLAHGGLDINNSTIRVIKKDEILKLIDKGATYIGLGDWHGFLEVIQNKCCYSGSLDILARDQKNAGYIALAVDDIVSFEKITNLKIEIMDIDLSFVKDISDIEYLVSKNASINTIRTINLNGSVKFYIDNDELMSKYAMMFYHLNIVNKSVIDDIDISVLNNDTERELYNSIQIDIANGKDRLFYEKVLFEGLKRLRL